MSNITRQELGEPKALRANRSMGVSSFTDGCCAGVNDHGKSRH